MRLGVLGLSLAFGGAVLASPVSSAAAAVDVPALAASAELIVVGRATVILRNADGASETVSIEVDRVLKGAAGRPARLSVELDLLEPGSGPIPDGRYGIFFLSAPVSDARYAVVDPAYPVLVAAPRSLSAEARPADPLAAVAAELSNVLATAPAALVDPVSGVEPFAGVSAIEQAQGVFYRAAAALKSIPFDVAAPGLRALAGSDRLATRLWALECLISMGGRDRLGADAAAYLASVRDILLDPGPDLAFAAQVLATALEVNFIAPEGIADLAALLRSRDVVVRRAAASVLGDIGTPASVAPLASIALHDTDAMVRYFAVLGLHDVAGVGSAPTVDAFEAGEAGMLKVWRTWADAGRLAPPTP